MMLKIVAAVALLALPTSVLAAPMVIVEPAVQQAMQGDTVSVDVLIDTDGLSLEGWAFSLSVGTGNVSGITRTSNASTLGLIPNFLGSPVIDAAAGDVRNVTASSFDVSLTPGTYLVETFDLVIDLASGIIDVTPFLSQGEVLGLDGGGCPPGNPPTCDPVFVAGSIEVLGATPEPVTALLLGGAFIGLLATRRRA